MAVPPPRPRAGMRDPGPSSPGSRELPPGSVVLGRYTIQKVLGRGGMATVYLARHQQTERLVALKLLDAEISRDPNYVERFRREARAAGRIRSEFVVAIYDLDAEVGGSLVLVMEYLEGQTVQQAMKGGRMPVERVLSFGRHLLEGLAAAHAAGVVHRDLKPANLFVERSATGSEKCKILDFGISKLADASQQELTRDGQTLGTVAYMAPEQIRGKASSTDPRIDLYAAGVTLFIMFTGKRPIDADDTVQLLAAVLENPPLTLAQAAGIPFPIALENFFAKALQKDPITRFQTALEMRDGLIEAGRSIGFETTGMLQLANGQGNGASPPMAGADPSPSSGVRSRTALGVGGPTPPRPTLMGVGNPTAPQPSMRPPPTPPPVRVTSPPMGMSMAGPPPMQPAGMPPAMPIGRAPEMAMAPPMPLAQSGMMSPVSPMSSPGGPAPMGNPFGPVPALPAAPPLSQSATVPMTASTPSAGFNSMPTRIALALAGIGTAALVTTAVVLTLGGRSRPAPVPRAAVAVATAPARPAPASTPTVAVARTPVVVAPPAPVPAPPPPVAVAVAPPHAVAPTLRVAPTPAPAPWPTPTIVAALPPVQVAAHTDVHRAPPVIAPPPPTVAAAPPASPGGSERARAAEHPTVVHHEAPVVAATTSSAPPSGTPAHHHGAVRRPGIVEAAPF